MARRRQKRRTTRRKRTVRRRKTGRRLGKRDTNWADYKAILGGAAAIAAGVKSGSSTTTTKGSDVWTENHADGIKYKTMSIKYKASKLAKLTKALSQPGSLYDYKASGSISNQGTQGASLLTSMDAANYAELYEALNHGVILSPVVHSRKMYLGLQQTEIEFNNAGPTTCEFEVYFLLDKNTGALSSPGALWDKAIIAQTLNGVAPLEDKTDLWNKPTTYKMFNIAYWTKRARCHLTPGESCRWTMNFNPQRILDTEYMDDNAAIRGLTYHVMVVQRGVLCDGTKTKAVTINSQTLAPTKLIWLIKRTSHGCILNDNARICKQRDGTTELPTAMGTVWHQDEDGGNIEDAQLDGNFA